MLLHSESVLTPMMESFSREGFQYPLSAEWHAAVQKDRTMNMQKSLKLYVTKPTILKAYKV